MQALTNMFSSSEFQQEFVELNLNLSDHFLDLSLALQLLKSPHQASVTPDSVRARKEEERDLVIH